MPYDMPYDQYKVHPFTLRVCRDSIRHNLGSINDLPRDVANAIANLYYREVCRIANHNENPNYVPQEVEEGKDFFVSVEKYIKARSHDLVWLGKMPELVKILRGAKLEMPQNVFRLLVDTLVFSLRYRRNGLDTPLIFQKVLRYILKPVREIPGLVDLVSERNASLDNANIDDLLREK